MQKISDKINTLYKKLFLLKKHPFYNDFDRVENITKEFTEFKKKKSKKLINFNPTTKIPNEENIEYENKEEQFDMNILKELSIEIEKPNSLDNIIKIVNKMYYMSIPSNVPDFNKVISFMKNSNKINIAVIGAGPVGLFLACYLFRYYNSSYGLNNNPKVNIIVFDNRLSKKGFKKPYTRNRIFSFNSTFFSYLIPNIYSWDNSNNGIMVLIYVLEYVLFCLAYYTFNIPFIFEDYTWEDYQKICKDSNIKMVFDCTGGRLETDIFEDVNIEWLKIFNKSNKKYPKLNVNYKKNFVSLDIDKNTFIKNYYYGSLNAFNNKNNEYFKILDVDITNYHDLKILLKIKDKHFSKESILKLVELIKDNVERNFIYNSILHHDDNNFYYKFDVFHTNMRHAIEISRVVNCKEHNFLYVASGDTIYHSHFITGSGLNRTITFAVKCANFITDISLI